MANLIFAAPTSDSNLPPAGRRRSISAVTTVPDITTQFSKKRRLGNIETESFLGSHQFFQCTRITYLLKVRKVILCSLEIPVLTVMGFSVKRSKRLLVLSLPLLPTIGRTIQGQDKSAYRIWLDHGANGTREIGIVRDVDGEIRYMAPAEHRTRSGYEAARHLPTYTRRHR